MNDYMLLMHRDAHNPQAAADPERWGEYLAWLQGTGQFDGGSSIGTGLRLRKGRPEQPDDSDLSGFIRVRAASLEEAKGFLSGNPVYEAGGTVVIRELPRN
ncbi:hypothetical protein V0R50_20320 [Pseudomonas sp. 148P]|uniref:YCII-related domain-containing protein n=1 Tax=Pseudomonas ulcerans TaxID=3115852 RepID=A0ABU7HVL4_9PSED|nr:MULTISPECIES: hypothetical protein [unclassified Pseudomonas]MEE1926263.1 hypothetical protein [Pseudomonas sp. 147P]MEE1935585.1 hypothetical protein [Pseudomonas sp. 148P]